MASDDDTREQDAQEVIPATDDEIEEQDERPKSDTNVEPAADDREGNEQDEDDEQGSEGGEESEYEIESILDSKMHKFVKGEWAYFVSWKGYDASHNSWVSAEDAENASELIDEYWKTVPKKKNAGKSLRKSTGGASSSAKARVSTSASKTDRRKSALSKQMSESEFSDIEVVEQPAAKKRAPRKSAANKWDDSESEEFIEKPAKPAPTKRGRLSKSAPKQQEDEEEEEMITRPPKKAKVNGTKVAAAAKPASSAMEEDAKTEPTVVQPFEEEEQEMDELQNVQDMKQWMHVHNWETLVQSVDTMEQLDNGVLRVYLTLEDGTKRQVDSAVANQRCPQKLLHFYEGHLKWRLPDT